MMLGMLGVLPLFRERRYPSAKKLKSGKQTKWKILFKVGSSGAEGREVKV